MRIFGFLNVGEAGGRPLALPCAPFGWSAQCSKPSSVIDTHEDVFAKIEIVKRFFLEDPKSLLTSPVQK